MQPKIIIAGLVVVVAGLWLLLSWEPVAREEHHAEDTPGASAGASAPAPELAQAPATPPVKAPPTAAQALPQPEGPQPDEGDELVYERTASGEIKSSMALETIPDDALDPKNMQPPASSGPLAQLEKEFEGAARDASSSALEKTVEASFRGPNVPAELFDSVSCHGAVCRAHTRWTRERAGGFMLAMMSLTVKSPNDPSAAPPPFSQSFAIGKAGDRNSNGERELDVYFRKAGD